MNVPAHCQATVALALMTLSVQLREQSFKALEVGAIDPFKNGLHLAFMASADLTQDLAQQINRDFLESRIRSL